MSFFEAATARRDLPPGSSRTPTPMDRAKGALAPILPVGPRTAYRTAPAPAGSATGSGAAAPPPVDPNNNVMAPWEAEKAYGDLRTRIDSMPNRSDDAYKRATDQFNGRTRPTSNFGAYYDSAVADTTRDLDSAYASRGMYKGSAATNAIGRETGRLRAAQARDQSNFDLAANQDERAWMDSINRAAAAGDTNELNRIISAMNLAQGSDAGKMNRLQFGFNSTFGPASLLMQLLNGGQNAMIGGDAAGMNSQYGADLAGTLAGIQQSQDQTNRLGQNVSQGLNLFGVPSAPTGGQPQPTSPYNPQLPPTTRSGSTVQYNSPFSPPPY
ncbi:MAG: hypothetical protein NW202_13515 [Nitrospira sp.]|nr:hypothetical protein [Nitrospira sp.]